MPDSRGLFVFNFFVIFWISNRLPSPYNTNGYIEMWHIFLRHHAQTNCYVIINLATSIPAQTFSKKETEVDATSLIVLFVADASEKRGR